MNSFLLQCDVFVRVLEEIEDTKKAFRDQLTFIIIFFLYHQIFSGSLCFVPILSPGTMMMIGQIFTTLEIFMSSFCKLKSALINDVLPSLSKNRDLELQLITFYLGLQHPCKVTIFLRWQATKHTDRIVKKTIQKQNDLIVNDQKATPNSITKGLFLLIFHMSSLIFYCYNHYSSKQKTEMK